MIGNIVVQDPMVIQELVEEEEVGHLQAQVRIGNTVVQGRMVIQELVEEEEVGHLKAQVRNLTPASNSKLLKLIT